MKGDASHVHPSYVHLGKSNVPSSNNTFHDFMTNYRKGQRGNVECALITDVFRPDPPLLVQPTDIYLKNIGLIPNYFGHIPGAAVR